MIPFAIYLLKVIVCSAILLTYYFLLLRNKAFHNYNRFYLLATLVLALTVPLLKIDIKYSSVQEKTKTIQLLDAVNVKDNYLDDIVFATKQIEYSPEHIALLIYIVISILFFIFFVLGSIKIFQLIKQNGKTLIKQIYLIRTTVKGTPFSFFNYVFWNDNIDLNSPTGQKIFKHELVHIRQKHSHDKLFINILLVFFWVNPFFWIIRKELNMLHEFVADKEAIEDNDTEVFAAMILQVAYPHQYSQLTSNFFYSPIKRRLIMLTKNNTSKAGYFSKLLALPLVFIIFAAFTFKVKKEDITSYHGKKIIVILDAGHGGNDGGAKNTLANILEKDMALSIAKKVKELNKNTDVDIVLTRINDTYQSPAERVAFTKAQNANLFISIHVDAATEDSVNIKSGMDVYVAKDNIPNVINSKLLASAVIGEFKNNYKLNVSSFPKQREVGIWTLQENTCPSVLLEVGFITNNKDLTYLQTEEAKETIANNLLNAISQYELNSIKKN